MSAHEESIRRDEWLNHARALRQLAASLVGDEHEANDLVQETWLRSSDEQRSKGPWLRTVLRNLVRDRSRERARRAWSERNAARDEGLPSSAEMAERLDVAQRVAFEVARLPDPYRTVIHLRYFEGLSPEEISRRGRIPLETVRTRLRRGLAQLRARMDGAYGGRREAWSVALGALAWRGKPALLAKVGGAMASAGGVLMSAKLLFAAALVAAGSVYVWQRSSSVETTEHALVSSTKPSDPSLERTELAALDDTQRSTPREVAPATEAAASANVADASIEVRGTVVITDENGKEHTNEAGVLKIAAGTNEAEAKARDVAFEHGQWSTRVAPGEWIAFVSLISNQREAALPSPKPIVPAGQPIVVRGEWTKRGRLRVIDAVTKKDLSDVEVRCSARGWRANEWTHPGDDERIQTVIDHAISPFDLPESTRYTAYWVHAPQHAWARIDFNHKTGGQRTIELAPTPSSVVVAIDGDLPKNAIVRLYPTEKTRIDVAGGTGIAFSMPEPDRMPSWLAVVSARASTMGPTRIDDLQSGKYLATVEVGEYEDKLRVGEAPVEVKPGETAHVTVPSDPSLLDVPRTHLFGTVKIPEGIDRANCILRLARVGGGDKGFQETLIEMSYAQSDRDTLKWDAGKLRTGDYIAYFSGIQHRELIHAPGPDETRVSLVIPPLVTVTVEVVDAANGASIEPDRLQWSDGAIEGVSQNMSVQLHRNPKTGRFEFVAPQGNVEVYCNTRGYEAAQQKLALSGSAMKCRLELHRATAIHVVMREDDAAIDVGYAFLSNVLARPESTQGHPYNALGSTGNETTCFVDAPGRYRIEFPALTGFEPIEPRSVDVAAGETVELVVRVKRNP